MSQYELLAGPEPDGISGDAIVGPSRDNSPTSGVSSGSFLAAAMNFMVEIRKSRGGGRAARGSFLADASQVP